MPWAPEAQLSAARTEAETVSQLNSYSEEEKAFLRHHLTPGEQRIVQDPDYDKALDALLKSPRNAFQEERAAILQVAQESQLEPYDYHLSLRHQVFNAALRQRQDLDSSIKEIDWLREISEAQYRHQLSQDPSFNPEVRLGSKPVWAEVNERTVKQPHQTSPDPSMSKQPTSSPQSIGTAFQNTQLSISDPDHSRRPSNINNDMPATTGWPRTQSNSSHDSEALTTAKLAVASVLGVSVTTFVAQTNSGIYRGPIMAETSSYFLQRLSARAVVAHPKDSLAGESLSVGQSVIVTYSNSKSAVREISQCKGAELER